MIKGGGIILDILKAAFYFGQGKSFQGTITIIEFIKKKFKNEEINFSMIFVNSLKASLSAHKDYLIEKANDEKQVTIMERKFLKALRREGVSYYTVELMKTNKKEFVERVSIILEEYFIISGVDDITSICRNITKQLWTELNERLSKNQISFNQHIHDSLDNIEDKIDTIQENNKEVMGKKNIKENSVDIEELKLQIGKINRNFIRSLDDLWVNAQFIEREETKKILKFLKDSEKRLIFVEGKAGYGKSNVLYEITRKLEQNSVPYLPLRLDRQIPLQNTTEQFGIELGLPLSPEKSLYELSKGKKAVLILDQMDAIRWTSQHSTKSWDLTKQIIEQALEFNNITIVIACRSYDLNNDPQISSWKKNKDSKKYISIEVDKLSLTEVRYNIGNMGINWTDLNNQERELLRTPLNLYLYSKIINEQNINSFSSELDLFNKYYEDIRMKFTEQMTKFTNDDWNKVLFDLINKLDQDQVLSVSKYKLDNEMAIEALISLNLLVKDKTNVSFFHQSFFDYVFARINFKSNKNIIDWLKSNEQSLFRREQLRQILRFSHKYNDSNKKFLVDIENLLYDDSIRFHLKHVVLQVLGNLTNPSIEEWELVKRLFKKTDWEDHILFEVLNDNQGWFDLLYNESVWVEWLSSDSKEQITKTIDILSNYVTPNPIKMISLLSPYINDPNWSNYFIALISRNRLTINREYFNFVLELINKGHFDNYRIYDIEDNLQWMAELIGVWLERQIAISDEELSKKYIVSRDFIKNPDGLLDDLIQKVSEESPEEYIKYVLPQIIILIKKTANKEDDFIVRDKIWYHQLNNNTTNLRILAMHEVLLSTMKEAFCRVARDNENYYIQVIDALLNLPYETVHYLILNGFINSSNKLADDAVNFVISILKQINGISIEYRRGWGELVRWAARSVIKRHANNCSKKTLDELGATLLSYFELWDYDSIEYRHSCFIDNRPSKWCLKKPNSFGFSQYILLSGIPEKLRTAVVHNRVLELGRKYGPAKLSEREKGGMVGSPIKWKEVEYMTDEQWLSAIAEYKLSSKKNTSILEGGPLELSRMLQTQAHKHGKRFADLMFKFPTDSHQYYYGAILDGITQKEVYNFKEDTDLVKPTEQASFEQICSVIRLLNNKLPNLFGIEVCRAMERLSDKDWPRDIINILITYTNLPHEDKSVTEEIKKSHDLLNNGINLLEGTAALAISSLLFKDYDKIDIFKQAIINLVDSPSNAVRSCAATCCLPILNFDRDLAVNFFLRLVETDDERLYATRHVQQFIIYAYHTHYDDLKDFISRMVKSSDNEVAEFGSIIQIRYWLEYEKDEDLAKKCIKGSEANRIGAAKLISNIFYNDKYFARVINPLKSYFNDPSKKVRQEASRVFMDFTGKEVDKLKEILSNYINSLAFEDDHTQMLRALEKGYNIKEISDEIFEIIDKCSIEKKESIKRGRYFYNSSLIPLLLKLYDDSSNMNTSGIRDKCLDSIDKMLRLRIGNMMVKINEIDR